MENQNIAIIDSIAFPNTADAEHQSFFRKESGFTFEGLMKSGEMAGIQWIQVFKDGSLFAEIKESVCDIYYSKL